MDMVMMSHFKNYVKTSFVCQVSGQVQRLSKERNECLYDLKFNLTQRQNKKQLVPHESFATELGLFDSVLSIPG